jgi:hypothetical protein
VNPADIVAVTFDVHTGTLLGFDTSSDRFVAFRGTDANHLAGVTATAVPQMNIGKAGSAGYGGRVVTTGNSLDTITATGNFSGSLVTAGTITRFTQTGGDFAGALAADRTITSVNITGGDFKAGGSVQTDLGLTTFTLTGGDLGGLLSAGSAGTITVHGSGLASADLLVIGNVKQVTFDGRFDGTMEFGSAGSISVGRELGAQALIEVQGPINTLNLGGMTAGSLVALNNTAGSITIGTVDSGTLSVRRSVNSIRTADTTDAILAVGINLGSLTVTGNATRTLFSSGVWIGDDHQYNTADDVIIGGAIGTATFQKNFTDSAVVAGVLPDLSVGPGMPDDKRAFVGNPTATDISQVDSATAGGVLVSTLGTLNFIGDVVSTQSAIGHIPVVAAANGIGRIVQRLRGNPIAHRVYGDPFGAPTVISASLINATDVQVVFSEPIDTGSLTVSRDADGDGTLGGPGDYTGSITVTDVQGHVLNGITLLYTTQTIPGAVQGVVTIRRTAGFPNGCIVTLSGSLTGPAIVDRSGLRSALRDFDRDGVPSVGEDTAGTILDGDGNGVEGGNYVLIASLHDTSTGFADAVKVDPVVDAGTVHIQGTFGPYDTGLEGMNFIIDSGMGLFTTLGDVDVYSFSAQAYQFVRLDLQTADVARMGLFYLNTQGTADPSDDTYQLVARWDINRVTNAITQTDRPKALQESFELPRTGQYFIALYGQQDPNAVTSPVTPTNPDGSVPYQLKVTLASSDDLLDGVANGYINTQPNDPIAYVSDTIGEHHNVLGAAADKRLVYLDFAGGLATDYHAIVNQDVRFRAMDLSLIDSQLAGLEQQVIEGNAATGVTGIVDHILSIYRHLPNSAVNVQRITTTDPKAALAQWLAADEGIYFTTVDPQTWGLDPKTDFTTVFVGETDNAVLGAGLYGIASDIPVAGETPSENAGIFVQNFVDPVTGATLLTGTTLAQKMNQASMMLANVAAHELGHTLGLNHQTTDRVNYILEPTPTDPNSGPAVMGYALVNIMETQEMYFGNAPLADAEFPMGIPPIGAPANYPVASIDTADMLAWWFG